MEHTTKNAPAATEAALQKTYTGNSIFNRQLGQIRLMLGLIATACTASIAAILLALGVLI